MRESERDRERKRETERGREREQKILYINLLLTALMLPVPALIVRSCAFVTERLKEEG